MIDIDTLVKYCKEQGIGVSVKDVKPLYNQADLDTRVKVLEGTLPSFEQLESNPQLIIASKKLLMQRLGKLFKARLSALTVSTADSYIDKQAYDFLLSGGEGLMNLQGAVFTTQEVSRIMSAYKQKQDRVSSKYQQIYNAIAAAKTLEELDAIEMRISANE